MKKKPFKREPTLLWTKHQPSYFHVSYRTADGTIPHSHRNQLSGFRKKNEVQSNQSKTRMINAINWLFLFSNKKTIKVTDGFKNKKTGEMQYSFTYRLGFITLTLPSTQKHTDEFIKEHMLQPLLYWLTRYYNCNYVWKAETQQNGRIHFHITVDAFIPWRALAAKWNTVCAKYEYCTVFDNLEKDYKEDAATQIKAIVNEKGLAPIIGGYLTKGSIEEKNHFDLIQKKTTLEKILAYNKLSGISQNIETRLHYSRFVEGRLWGCSESLSKIEVYSSEMNEEYSQEQLRTFCIDNQAICLGKKLYNEERLKYIDIDYNERVMRQITDEDLKRKYNQLEYVFIHKNLKYCKLPRILQRQLHEEKLKRNFSTQQYFTIKTLN